MGQERDRSMIAEHRSGAATPSESKILEDRAEEWKAREEIGEIEG